MKTTEFITSVNQLDAIDKVVVENYSKNIVLYKYNKILARVYTSEQSNFLLNYPLYNALNREDQGILYRLLTEYDTTPVTERGNVLFVLKNKVEEELAQCIPEGYTVEVLSNPERGVICISKLEEGSLPLYIHIDTKDNMGVYFIPYGNHTPSIPLDVITKVLNYVQENKHFLTELWEQLAKQKEPVDEQTDNPWDEWEKALDEHWEEWQKNNQ